MTHDTPDTSGHLLTEEGGKLSFGSPPPPIRPIDIHRDVDEIVDQHDGLDEYVVDLEIHQTFLVRAASPEIAAAKAVLQNDEPDENVSELGRDVHICVHTDSEEGEEEHEYDEGE